MPAWQLSTASVIAPAVLLAAPEAVANSKGIRFAGVLAEVKGIDLESLVQLIGMLLLVLGLFAAFAWSVKRWRLLPQMRGAQNRLQILETKSLGQRNSLMVVGYGEERFLIGTNSTGIQLLGQLPGEKKSLSQTEEGDAGESAEARGDEKESERGVLSGVNRHIGKEDA